MSILHPIRFQISLHMSLPMSHYEILSFKPLHRPYLRRQVLPIHQTVQPNNPSDIPTNTPSDNPTNYPSSHPTINPTLQPTIGPSSHPSNTPSSTSNPTTTNAPTANPITVITSTSLYTTQSLQTTDIMDRHTGSTAEHDLNNLIFLIAAACVACILCALIVIIYKKFSLNSEPSPQDIAVAANQKNDPPHSPYVEFPDKSPSIVPTVPDTKDTVSAVILTELTTGTPGDGEEECSTQEKSSVHSNDGVWNLDTYAVRMMMKEDTEEDPTVRAGGSTPSSSDDLAQIELIEVYDAINDNDTWTTHTNKEEEDIYSWIALTLLQIAPQSKDIYLNNFKKHDWSEDRLSELTMDDLKKVIADETIRNEFHKLLTIWNMDQQYPK
eukprot:1144415_1